MSEADCGPYDLIVDALDGYFQGIIGHAMSPQGSAWNVAERIGALMSPGFDPRDEIGVTTKALLAEDPE